MARNLKRDYLKKLQAVETANGYKVALAQYVYGMAHGDEYPALSKVIETTDKEVKYSKVYYFKYYDGSGKYFRRVYTVPNNKELVSIANVLEDTELEASNRYNLNKLIKLAENF